jgi:hypothetical protein
MFVMTTDLMRIPVQILKLFLEECRRRFQVGRVSYVIRKVLGDRTGLELGFEEVYLVQEED